jgi:hypothetical protein
VDRSAYPAEGGSTRPPESLGAVSRQLGYGAPMHRILCPLIGIAALLAAATPPAGAAPRKLQVTARLGIQSGVSGLGCAAETLSAPTRARSVVRIEPGAGTPPGGHDGIVVADATVAGGRVSWVLVPDQATCDGHATEPGDWPWAVPRRSWSVTYRERAYAIVAARDGAVRSLAGLPVAGRAPNLAAARRVLGRPTSVHPTRGARTVACDASWRPIGLTIKFVTFGLGRPCRDGVVQAASVTGRHAREWVAVVDGSVAIPYGNDIRFLSAHGLAERDAYGRRTWTLAEVWWPIGDADYVPSVMARVDAGTVTGFDAWIGGAGD